MPVSMGTVLTNALSISPKIWLKSQQMVPLRLPKPGLLCISKQSDSCWFKLSIFNQRLGSLTFATSFQRMIGNQHSNLEVPSLVLVLHGGFVTLKSKAGDVFGVSTVTLGGWAPLDSEKISANHISLQVLALTNSNGKNSWDDESWGKSNLYKKNTRMYYPYMNINHITIISRSTLILRIIHSLYVVMCCIDLTKQDGCQPWKIRSLEYLPRSLGLEASHEAGLIFPFLFPPPKKKTIHPSDIKANI